VGHGAGDRPHRIGKDDDALFRAFGAQQARAGNISTAEDPVEYNLHGINQVQMHDEIGLNFAMSLRAFLLRQDPDIIMVGEVRDFETAEIAVKAAFDRAPRALDASHERCSRHDLAALEHGRSNRSSSPPA